MKNKPKKSLYEIALKEMRKLKPNLEKVALLLQKAMKAKDPRAADRKSTRLNSSHIPLSRMPSSA